MTKKERFTRIPIPEEKPENFSSSAWKVAKKRGWYCPNFIKTKSRGSLVLYDSDNRLNIPSGRMRYINYDGEDYLAQYVNNYISYKEFYNFICKSFFIYSKKHNLTWDYIQKCNPGLEFDDIIQELMLRVFEVRSDARGKNNEQYFLNIAASHCGSYLKSLKKHRQGIRFLGNSLEEMKEKQSKEIKFLF